MRRAEVWGRGITAGILGGVAVMTWFLIIDLLVGWPFLTAGALGSGIFLGARDARAVEVSLTTVGGYAALHFLVFVAFGVAASLAVARAERRPRALLAVVLVVATLATFLLGLLAIVAEVLLGDLAWWAVAAGGILGGLGLAGYLWATDGELERAARQNPFHPEE